MKTRCVACVPPRNTIPPVECCLFITVPYVPVFMNDRTGVIFPEDSVGDASHQLVPVSQYISLV